MNNTEKTSRIYDKQTRTWLEITPEQYEEYDRWRTRIRKREQYHGRCMADTMESGLGGSFRTLKSAVEGLAISFGERLAPRVQKGVV